MDEFGIFRGVHCATYLDEQEQIGILALGGGTDALLDVVLDDVDTLTNEHNDVQHFRVQDEHNGELTILRLPDLLIRDLAKRRRRRVAEELASTRK